MATDLIVEKNQRHIQGYKVQVDVIYRRIDDPFWIRWRFYPIQSWGVRADECVSRRQCGDKPMPPGTGIADDKSLYPFVPKNN